MTTHYYNEVFEMDCGSSDPINIPSFHFNPMTVLVVGLFCTCSLLHAWDAEVTTTCSTDAVKLCETLGASHVIDYKTTDVRHELFKVKG